MTQMPPAPMMQPGSLREAPGATAGLVFGIISIVLNVPVIGLILAFIGLQKSNEAKALCAANPGYYNNAGTAQAGFVCSIVGLCMGGLSTLCGCGYLIVVLAALAGVAGAGAGGGP